MGMEKKKIGGYVLFLFLFMFSCKTKTKANTKTTADPKIALACPDSKIKQTHSVYLEGLFTVDAETIVPAGEKAFPITLNIEDLKKLNEGADEVLCRVLERRGIGSGTEGQNHGFPVLNIERGPGLKLKGKKVEFLIPPAEKAAELLTNFEHSLDRLLDS